MLNFSLLKLHDYELGLRQEGISDDLVEWPAQGNLPLTLWLRLLPAGASLRVERNTPILLNIGRKLQVDNTQLQYNGWGHALMYQHHRYGLAPEVSVEGHDGFIADESRDTYLKKHCQIIGATLSKFRRCECFNSITSADQPWKWAAQMSRCMGLREILVVRQATTEYDRGWVEGDCQWYEHRYLRCSYDTLGNTPLQKTNNSTSAGLLSASELDRFYPELNGILLRPLIICTSVKLSKYLIYIYIFKLYGKKIVSANIPR